MPMAECAWCLGALNKDAEGLWGGCTRDDLIRLVVGMQWREMVQSMCVLGDNGFLALDGGVDPRVEVTFDEVHEPASTIVDEWLGVRS